MSKAASKAQTKTDRAEGAGAPGVIRRDEVYTREEALRRLRWQRGALATAKEAGLIVVRAGNRTYLFGSDIFDYLARLRDQQNRRDADG